MDLYYLFPVTVEAYCNLSFPNLHIEKFPVLALTTFSRLVM